MAEKYDLPILYSCHPRSRKRLEESGFRLDPRVIRHEPLGFHDYNCLQMNAFCVVSDSGTLPEETNRRIVDIISDVNLAYSEHARRYLADCGLPKERTYVTGSPMAEVLTENLAAIEASDIHARLGLEKGK